MGDKANISFLGFGEAARAFADGLRQEPVAIDLRAFDIKTGGPDAEHMRADYALRGVTGAASAADACSGAHLVFSLVTADQAGDAARSAAQGDLNGAFFLDCNSCAPSTKRRSAEIIETAGGRYVDVAVMTPVHPRLHKSPCLLAGPEADAAQAALAALGMSVETAGVQIGDASTRKMIRSVMIKGLEALTLECFLAARAAGIETDILASLDASFPGFDWDKRAAYMFERVATHGIRRATEMDEVVKTLADLGIDPFVATGTVARQRQVGELGLTVSARDATDLTHQADAILSALHTYKKEH